MTSLADDSLSKLVYTVLDISGINQEMKSLRKRVSHRVESRSRMYSSADILLSGSTTEGLFPFMRSDLDAMIIYSDIVCLDVPDNELDINTLQTDYRNCPPGYVRVVPINLLGGRVRNSIIPTLCSLSSSSTQSEAGLPFISSFIFQDLCRQWMKLCLDAVAYDNIRDSVIVCNGPAITHTALIDLNFFDNNLGACIGDADIVNSIKFVGSNTLQYWTSRPRFYDWPPLDLKMEISSMQGFIVPVGEKQSENQNIEWRISYVTAERKLLSKFNSTLDKLFAILKILSKEVLTPICKNFSSYIMKNVVLWTAERNPSSVFQPCMLLDLFLLCLSFLKLCLQNNHLPNYMFSERNLIAGRIVGHEKKNLVDHITVLLSEGKACVARIPRVLQYLRYATISPDTFLRYGPWRNEVEKLLLIEATIMLDYLETDMAFRRTGIFEMIKRYCGDDRFLCIQMRLMNLVVPNWVEKVFRGQLYEVICLLSNRVRAVWHNEMILD